MPTPPPVREFVRLAKAKSTLVKELSADEAEAHLDDLAGILADAVESGASVSFLLPFTLEMGRAFWQKVIAAVRENAAVLLGAYSHGELVGTVQLRLDTPANQQHRGEIVKLLVHRRARGQGIGRALLQALKKVRAKGAEFSSFSTRTRGAPPPSCIARRALSARAPFLVTPSFRSVGSATPASTSRIFEARRLLRLLLVRLRRFA